MDTVQVSKKVVGETRTEQEAMIVERREIQGEIKGEVKKSSRKAAKAKSTKKKTTKKKVAKKASAKDDLKKVEGIGPKIEQLLNADKIYTFKQLAGTKTSVLKKILDKAGPRYQMHNPATWPKQSAMAAKGDWAKLQKWQDELKGGRK